MPGAPTDCEGHPPFRPLQHWGAPQPLSSNLITRPPMQQAAILCVLCLVQWFPGSRQAASTEAPQGGSDGPPGVNAVQFVVLPFHSSGSSGSGRPPSVPTLGTPIQVELPWGLHCHCALPCIHLVFYAFGGKIAKVADDHNSLETKKMVEERKTDETNFKRDKLK